MGEKSLNEEINIGQGQEAIRLSQNFDTCGITKCNLDLASVISDKDFSDPVLAFTLENIFTVEECKSLIQAAEAQNFSNVSVSHGGLETINENLRSGSRVMIDDEEFVAELWRRISSFIPRKVKGAQVVGLNERLRFLKYLPNQFFAAHTDGSYARENNKLEISLLTIQMYLNDDFDGGETTFVTPPEASPRIEPRIPVKPKTGMALVFGQDLYHEGSVVKSGVKYTVRTDVMYRYGI